MVKRILAMILSIVMVISMLPVQALASEAPAEETTAPEETQQESQASGEEYEDASQASQETLSGETDSEAAYRYFESIYGKLSGMISIAAASQSGYPPYAGVQYAYAESVECGTIRYISQVTGSPYFDWNYWPTESFGSYSKPGRECGTSCISMALSYIGINRTPKSMLEEFNGRTAPMFSGLDGTTYSPLSVSQISSAVDNYINGNGTYSPVVIHLNIGATYDGEDDDGHYVMIVGKVSENVWQVMDPASDYLTNYEINGASITYCGIANTIDQVHQWYNPNGGIGYLGKCAFYPTHVRFNISAESVPIMSLPCTSEENPESQQVNTALLGQTWTALGLYKNDFGGYWYKVTAQAGLAWVDAYLPADAVTVSGIDASDIAISEISAPGTHQKGKSFPLKGLIESTYSSLKRIDANVYRGATIAGSGTPLTGTGVDLTIPTYSYRLDNSAVDAGVKFGSLDVGEYTLVIKVTYLSYYLDDTGSLAAMEESSHLPLMFTVTDEEATYTLTYDLNGGDGENTVQEVAYGTAVTVMDLPQREGYTCIGWGTSPSATVAAYQPGDTITITKNTTLYALWKIQTGTAVAEGSCGDNLRWVLDSNGTLTISGTGAMGNYGYKQAPWYSYCDQISQIVISDGVTGIAGYAFYGCKSLTGITIAQSVVTVADNAFSGCTGITTAGVIGSGCDYEFGWTTAIPANAFSYLSNLEKVTIPGTVTSVGDNAFYACDKLISAGPIGSGCNLEYGWTTEIPASTFLNMYTLLTFAFPETGMIRIGDNAFAACEYLTEITLPDNLEEIGFGAFSNCRAIQTLVIPESVRTIDRYAFSVCTSLTSVEILGSITEIKEHGFYYNTSLKEILIPRSVVKIGAEAFCDCSALTDVYFTGTEEEWAAITVEYGNEALSNAEIHYNWETSQTVGGACGDAAVWTLDSSGHLVISGTGDVTGAPWLESYASQITKVTIEGGITGIYACAFQGCVNLQKVTLPDSLKAIGDRAFRQTGLTKIVIPEGVTQIGKEAFAECTALKRAAIPRTAASIGEMAFAYCTALTDVFLMSEQAAVGENAFQGCDDINSVYFFVPEENIADIQGIETLENAPYIYYDWNSTEETSAMVQRYLVWHNLLKEAQTLCLKSEVKANFCITAGLRDEYDNAEAFALEQNGQYVLRNSTGKFDRILPSDIFVEGAPVYAVILDGFGNVIYRACLKLELRQTYTIHYVYWDKGDGNSKIVSESFVEGEDIQMPVDPTSEDYYKRGYRFCGWYASRNYEGTHFFHATNQSKRKYVTGDITVYAKWIDSAELSMGWDNWGFANIEGNPFNPARYEISQNDLDKLLEGLSKNDKSEIEDKLKESWTGSCFGMSASVVLGCAGDVKMEAFTDKNSFFDVKSTDPNIDAVESMINFYQLSSMVGQVSDVRTGYMTTPTQSGRLKNIINKMAEADAPVALTIGIWPFGHTVVAYDLVKQGHKYTFKVYDCSYYDSEDEFKTNKEYTVEVTEEDGTYTADCGEWAESWSNYNIKFRTCLTAEDLRLNTVLVAPGEPVEVSAFGDHGNGGYYELKTDYCDFLIHDGVQSAQIVNGEVSDGDLSIVCMGGIGEIGLDPEYLYLLPVLEDGRTYSITPNCEGSNSTSLHYRHETNGFYISETADGAGTLAFTPDGSITTQYQDEVVHSVWATYNSMSTPWYIVEIQGASTGLRVSPSGGNVAVASETETNVTVATSSDFNSVTVSEVPVGTEAVLVEEGEDRACIITRNGETIASSAYGYSVVFNSQLGTNVDALTNVPAGSLIEEPAEPTRTGYVFRGWYIDEEYTKLWDFAVDTVTADLMLYACWSVDPDYTKSVTFRVPGMADQIVYLPVDSLIPADYAPLDENGEALSWYTDSAYTNAWDFETDTITADLILYGKTPLCTVSYMTNNGQTLASSELYAGMTVSKPEGLILEGYTLCGWYTDEAFTAEWHFETPVCKNMTLYARWLPNERDKDGKDTGICIEILNEESYVYTGKAIKPEILVRDGGAVLTAGKDYTVSYKNNTRAWDRENLSVKESMLPQIIIQGKGNYKSAGKITKYFTIRQADMKDLQITVPSFVTVKSGGKLQKITPSVKTELAKVSAKDYTIHYYTDAELTQPVQGITEAGLYYVVLEAQKVAGYYLNNLRGITEAFVIQAAPAKQMLSSAKVTVPKTITAAEQMPEENAALQMLISKVVLNKVTYLTDADHIEQFKSLFVVTAGDSDGTEIGQSELGTLLMSAGTKTLRITAKEGNPEGFVGEKTVTIKVKGPALKKNQFQVTFDQTGAKTVLKTPYSGASQVPAVISDLEEGTDYTVIYKSGKKTVSAGQIRNAGTYSLVITGKGRFSGTLTYKFTITKVDLAKAYAAGSIKIQSFGKAVYSPAGAKIKVSVSYINSSGVRVVMTEGTDYTLSYSGNKTVTEKAAVTLKGKGNFSGSLSKSKASELVYTVVQKPLSASDISVTVTGLTMKKGSVTAVKYTVNHGGKKVAASQYTSQLTDEGGDTVTLKIIGKDKLYTGSRCLEVRKDLIKTSDSKKVKISLPKNTRYYFTGSPVYPDITITDAKGNDISDCFTVTYGANTNVGKGKVIVTGRPEMGYYGTKTVTFTILPKWAKWIFG